MYVSVFICVKWKPKIHKSYCTVSNMLRYFLFHSLSFFKKKPDYNFLNLYHDLILAFDPKHSSV